jgi:hypothetical protein
MSVNQLVSGVVAKLGRTLCCADSSDINSVANKASLSKQVRGHSCEGLAGLVQLTFAKDVTAVMLRYKRVLLKLSGEALMGNQGFGIDPEVVQEISQEVKEIHALGVEVAIVIGGGNIFRGITATNYGVDRVTADYMGMLATVMNGLALQGAMEKEGVITRLQTAIEMHQVASPIFGVGHPPSREGASRDLCRWQWQSLFHYGHDRFAPGGRDRC